MTIQYKLTKKLKKAIHKSSMTQYEISQKVGIDRALLSIFMNKAYISPYYKEKIIKVGKLVGLPANECLELVND